MFGVKHAVPLSTMFRRCVLVNFAVDPRVMRTQLPEGIEPDEYAGASFLSIVIAQMERMRPAGTPPWLGIDYNQVVYRVVVKVGEERGVFFWRSDADNLAMCLAGNVMSFFRFHPCRLDISESDGTLRVTLRSSAPSANIDALFDLAGSRETLPSTSRFPDLTSAREFLVELYSAFARPRLDAPPTRVTIRRGRWGVRVVDDVVARYPLLQGGPVFDRTNARFDSAFFARDVPYQWNRLTIPKRPPDQA